MRKQKLRRRIPKKDKVLNKFGAFVDWNNKQIRKNISVLQQSARQRLVHLVNTYQQRYEKETTRGLALAFYVASDPYTSKHLSCIASPGTRFPAAAMHSLLASRVGRSGLTGIQSKSFHTEITFFENASTDDLCDQKSEVSALIASDPDKFQVFGDFVTREEICSRARFVRYENGRVVALLTVNFRDALSREEWNQQAGRYQALFHELIFAIPALRESGSASYTKYLPLLLEIQTVARKFRGSLSDSLFKKIPLVGILDILADRFSRDSEGDVFSSAYLIEDSTHLRLIGKSTSHPEVKSGLSILNGEGVVSWAALRRKTIRINDFEYRGNSPFRKIRVSFDAEIRSQLVVPIEYDDWMVGVLCLEGRKPNAFPAEAEGFVYTAACEIGELESGAAKLGQLTTPSRDLGLDEGGAKLVAERLSQGTPVTSDGRSTGVAKIEVDVTTDFEVVSFGSAMEGAIMKNLQERFGALLVGNPLVGKLYSFDSQFMASVRALPGGAAISDIDITVEELSSSCADLHLKARLDKIVLDWLETGDSQKSIELIDRDLREDIVDMKNSCIGNPHAYGNILQQLSHVEDSVAAAKFAILNDISAKRRVQKRQNINLDTGRS